MAKLKNDMQKMKCYHGSRPSGAVYGLGFVGAAIYFVQAATTFGEGVVGILKAIVWPAFIVYEALKFFHL